MLIYVFACVYSCLCVYVLAYLLCVRGVCVHALVGRSQKTTSPAHSILWILFTLVLVFGLLRLFLFGVALFLFVGLFVLFLFFETGSLTGLELDG